MRWTRKAVAVSVLTFLTFLSPPRAQGVFDMGQLTNTLSLDALTQSLESQSAGQSSGKSSGTAAKVVTTFRPSAEVRKRNFAQFVSKVRATDPGTATELEKAFASQDVIGVTGKEIAKYGLKTNDVADALTVYFITAWYGMRGRDDDPSRALVTAVRGQFVTAMGRTPGFAKTTDAQRQEIAEAMLIQAMLVSGYVQAAKQNPSLAGQIKTAIAQGAKATFGFDLGTVQLTEQGLQRS